MADNTLTNYLPKLLELGQMALRERAIMPRIVNRSLDDTAQKQGDVINVPIPSAIAARTVTPAVTQAANQTFSPTNAVVTLDFWREATFHVSDRDTLEIADGALPMQASEAIKSLANAVDDHIIAQHTGIYSFAGVAGTTPFNASLNMVASARQLLFEQLAPADDRRAVIDPSADANLLLNAAVLQFDQRGDPGGIIRGEIGTKLGFDWFMDQNITTFTPGTGWVTGFSLSTVSGLSGETTLNVLNATSSGTILVGDLFTIDGVAGENYRVAAAATASSTVAVALTIDPALRQSHATAVAITVVATAYTANLAFHRDAFAWASRPLQGIGGVGNVIQGAVDPVSGLALRIEVSRQYKQTTFAYDILGGAGLIRSDLATKILG